MTPMQARDCYYVLRAMHDGACPKCGYIGSGTAFEQRQLDGKLQRLECPNCHFALPADEIEGIRRITPHVLKRRVESLEACRTELMRGDPKIEETA